MSEKNEKRKRKTDKCRKIIFFNQKGGVGKTTSTLEFAFALMRRGFKVLVIDLDRQGNLSSGLRINKLEKGKSIINFLEGDDYEICSTDFDIDIIPANIKLAKYARAFAGELDRERIVRKRIAPLEDEYDFILIDSHPSLDDLVVSAVSACDDVITPIKLAQFSLEGFDDCLDTFCMVKEYHKPDIKGPYVLFTLKKTIAKSLDELENEILTDLDHEGFVGGYFETQIRDSVALEKARALKTSVYDLGKNSNASVDYENAVEEYLERFYYNE